MKVAIRLQNHGKRNHPLWWIVIAYHRQNIRGRFIEHVGYWSPRHGVNLQRQIILNIPRIKHWIANGAIPTFKVHKFLSLWGIFPTPWHFKKTPQQLQAEKKPQQQMTDKQKRKAEMKAKRKARFALDPINFYKYYNRYNFFTGFERKFQEIVRMNEKENEILREMYLSEDFQKIKRIQQLSKVQPNLDVSLKRMRQNLTKAKSQLALMQQNYQHSHPLQQIKTMQLINNLTFQIRAVEQKKFYHALPKQPLQEGEDYISESTIQKLIDYELITKKIQKMQQEMKKYYDLARPITMQEFADTLRETCKLNPEQAMALAQDQYIRRGAQGYPMTKLDVLALRDQSQFTNFFDMTYYGETGQERPQNHKMMGDDPDLNLEAIYKNALDDMDGYFPTGRPVNPFPDVKSYIPQEYYEPVTEYNLKPILYPSVEPHQQLQKYYQLAGKNKNIQPKKKDQFPKLPRSYQLL